MKWKKCSDGAPPFSVKMFWPVFAFDDRLVDVHGRAGLALNGLGHEGGVDIVLERGLADGALEHEHLVGEFDRIAVAAD
jgi:hypothetical protein